MSQPHLDEVLRKLDLAFGKLTLPDWQQHAEALADAVGGLSDLFLHVDAKTGHFHVEPIFTDPSRVVLGMVPKAIAPLVRLLERQTKQLDLALENGWQMPPNEEPAWTKWHLRLHHYVANLELELRAPEQPSERLWDEVTAPLLQGIFPESFAELGIVNPAVPSKPDVATVPSTAFMVALQTQEVSRLQAWLLSWREGLAVWIRETKDAIESLLANIGEGAREGARKVVGVALGILLVGGLSWVGWKLVSSSSKERDRRRAITEES